MAGLLNQTNRQTTLTDPPRPSKPLLTLTEFVAHGGSGAWHLNPTLPTRPSIGTGKILMLLDQIHRTVLQAVQNILQRRHVLRGQGLQQFEVDGPRSRQ
jgi:hypothetical protein